MVGPSAPPNASAHQALDKLLELADSLIAARMWGDAETVLARAVEAFPDRSDAYVRWAQLLLDRKENERAKELLSYATRSHSGNAHLHFLLGSALLSLDRKIEAVVARQNALKLEPESPQRLLQFGQALLFGGYLSAAEQQVRAAIASAPDLAEAHFELSQILPHLGRIDEAIQEAETACALSPSAAPMHAHLGSLFELRGDLLHALQAWEQASARDPGNGLYREHVQALSAPAPRGPEDHSEAAQSSRESGLAEPSQYFLSPQSVRATRGREVRTLR